MDKKQNKSRKAVPEKKKPDVDESKKKKKEMDDTEINNVLMSIGKKTRNPNAKQFVNGFVGKIKSKTEGEDSDHSTKSAKSSKSAKSGKKNAKLKGYERPNTTFTDNLDKEEVEKKLEDYQKVDDLTQVPLGTHLRYFTKKDGELVFRMGGVLKRNSDLPKFIILKNAVGVEWSVQVADSIFYKKMTIQEIKEEYENIIKELNDKIKKLKSRIKELEK
jgi:hypothetical protein